ncbi:hypothetical protein A2767_04070 [Candidatus Roizmanbacteria bacterium RIFCSPHIGHO2_01_FULL_35_10]|uniref:EfeO-type cupredoxin-like domain-containing protein n=1 Tax=Candidatus Roizmanbacteria bacterium RIFCSPLOWO2_01_FULL_35_13 TaxID=1802055 RepID=A0A1F7IH76_9BACT|nr:MAG: hypothetical protein A2767_04070 [Candidatus Roizmanbacteria bacterium RIFCSPHIGHO2_01_FULL_35_10]OGK42683.1 MAG: hypothetical protein A3A74_00045 [Candidatus Roizmanbacteria bacterium RIFCSPLOWO2_01_FULL_35_13]
MKNSGKLFLFFVIISIFALAFYFTRQKNSLQTYNSSASEPVVDSFTPTNIPPQTISITANNNTFDPSDLYLVQNQDTILRVDAQDQDYIFELKEFDIYATAPQGQVSEILLPAKAIGTFTYSCGPTCTGQVHVEDNDADAVYE